MTPDEPPQPEVDETQLERSQDAIDEAREAAKKVAELENLEVGDPPGFAESTPGMERPRGAANGVEGDDDLED